MKYIKNEHKRRAHEQIKETTAERKDQVRNNPKNYGRTACGCTGRQAQDWKMSRYGTVLPPKERYIQHGKIHIQKRDETGEGAGTKAVR